MTRKDYVKFADMLKATKPTPSQPSAFDSTGAIRLAHDTAAWATWAAVVRGMVDVFCMDNQQFDHARFYARIGIDPADVA